MPECSCSASHFLSLNPKTICQRLLLHLHHDGPHCRNGGKLCILCSANFVPHSYHSHREHY